LRKAGEQKRAWLSSSDTVAFRSIGQSEGPFGHLDVRWPSILLKNSFSHQGG
jgi:hypothetical protein